MGTKMSNKSISMFICDCILRKDKFKIGFFSLISSSQFSSNRCWFESWAYTRNLEELIYFQFASSELVYDFSLPVISPAQLRFVDRMTAFIVLCGIVFKNLLVFSEKFLKVKTCAMLVNLVLFVAAVTSVDGQTETTTDISSKCQQYLDLPVLLLTWSKGAFIADIYQRNLNTIKLS